MAELFGDGDGVAHARALGAEVVFVPIAAFGAATATGSWLVSRAMFGDAAAVGVSDTLATDGADTAADVGTAGDGGTLVVAVTGETLGRCSGLGEQENPMTSTRISPQARCSPPRMEGLCLPPSCWLLS